MKSKIWLCAEHLCSQISSQRHSRSHREHSSRLAPRGSQQAMLSAAGGEPGAALPVAGGMPLTRDLGTEVLRVEQHI